MPNLFDLQIQSTASDGRHAPSDIVAMAKERGVRMVAITDHDTIGGIAEAVRAGQEVGMRVLPGIEISAEDHDIHILGYGIDETNPALLASLQEARAQRIEGAKKMVENLSRAGLAIAWEDVLRYATGDTVARPHIARAAMGRPENAGALEGIATVHDFIKGYLGNDNPNYVHRSRISASDAIGLLHDAGGVAVWSHPVIPDFRGGQYDALEEFLKMLIEWGLDGIEVFNPSHTEDDVEFLEGLAQKYNIVRTGGSDFHEANDEPVVSPEGLHSAGFIGDYETFGFATDDILPRLDAAIAARRQRAQSGNQTDNTGDSYDAESTATQ